MFVNFAQIHSTRNGNCLKCRSWWKYIGQSPIFKLLRSRFSVIIWIESRINSISQNFTVFRVHNNYCATLCVLFINHLFNFFFTNVLNCRINRQSYIFTFWICGCSNRIGRKIVNNLSVTSSLILNSVNNVL